MSLYFYIESLIVIFSIINSVENKMKNPPIQIWDEKLNEYFSSHNISNFINIEPKKCDINESYYLFVIQTLLKMSDIDDEVETLGYTGFCLKEYNITPVEHSLINYYYLWDKSKMNSSSLIEIKKINKNIYLNEKNSIKLRLFGAAILLYLLFVLIVTIFKKKVDDKFNLKEYERIRKEREEDDNNNADNINNDNNDYNDNLLNNEDKPPADIIIDLSNDRNYKSISRNISNLDGESINSYEIGKDGMNEKEEKKEIKKNPLIKETNIYNELFNNKRNKDQLWNSFNIFQNIKLLCEFTSLRKINSLKPIQKEIFIMETFKCLSYLILMYYTCLPIIERLPFKHPEKFYELVKNPLFFFIFNADLFYNILFLIEGISISYFYLFNTENYCFSYIIFEIIYKIIPNYFLMSVLYFLFINSHIFFNNPLSKYFHEKENINCECQQINIFLLIANFTYGTKEKYFPFCLYHFWYLFTWFQYYIVGMLLLLCYINFKSFFYVIYIMIYFICLLLRLISLNIYSPPFTIYNIIQRNLKTYFMRSGLKIFTRAGPFLIGFLFGIYYHENKNSKKSLLTIMKKNNAKLLLFSLLFFLFIFIFQYFINLNYVKSDQYLAIILAYIFKVFKHDIFILGFLGLLIYFFINIEKSSKVFRLFNNHIFLFLKKLSLTSYLVMSIIARIFFYSFREPFRINIKIIITYIFGGLCLNLLISFILNIFFVIPLQRVNSIIKSTYIK